MGSVASLLAMDRTSLTAALKPLERRGLVRISADTNDRRGKRLELTGEGMAVLAAAVPVWESTHGEVDALLEEGDPEWLRRKLGAFS